MYESKNVSSVIYHINNPKYFKNRLCPLLKCWPAHKTITTKGSGPLMSNCIATTIYLQTLVFKIN